MISHADISKQISEKVEDPSKLKLKVKVGVGMDMRMSLLFFFCFRVLLCMLENEAVTVCKKLEE